MTCSTHSVPLLSLTEESPEAGLHGAAPEAGILWRAQRAPAAALHLHRGGWGGGGDGGHPRQRPAW